MTNVKYFERLLDSFEAFAAKQMVQSEPENLYLPIQYHLGLKGKRLRPMALLMVNDFYNGDPTPALHAALAIEWFHNFTLMHDDIMDNASLRRNQVTTHVKYGVNAAILSGDLLLIQSFQQMLRAQELSQAPELLRTMLTTAEEVCLGQALDVEFEKSLDNINMDAYLEMIHLKTATLLATAMSIGARLNKVSADIPSRWYKLGSLLGTSFQLQDDYLDYYGDTDKIGKQKGGDILQCKKSALVVEIWPNLSHEDREYYNDWPKDADAAQQKLYRVNSWFEKWNVKENILRRISSYERAVHQLIDLLNLPHDQMATLSAFISSVFSRRG